MNIITKNQVCCRQIIHVGRLPFGLAVVYCLLLSRSLLSRSNLSLMLSACLPLGKNLKEYIDEICTASLFSVVLTEEEIYPTHPSDLNGALDSSRAKTYLKNSLYPLMHLFGKNRMPDVDNLLTSFYQLDDEARKEAVDTIQFKLQYHKEPERAEQVNKIKGWFKKTPMIVKIFGVYCLRYLVID